MFILKIATLARRSKTLCEANGSFPIGCKLNIHYQWYVMIPHTVFNAPHDYLCQVITRAQTPHYGGIGGQSEIMDCNL